MSYVKEFYREYRRNSGIVPADRWIRFEFVRILNQISDFGDSI